MGSMERIGFTGHQGLTAPTEKMIRAELRRKISAFDRVQGVSSLAEGADQIFAEIVLDTGGELMVVIPSSSYEGTFDTPGLEKYRQFLQLASTVIRLDYSEPSEEAFWAAGKYIVDASESVIAVWNGKPAGGLGGTADVVDYAREQGKVVTIVWPEGSSRK